MKRLYILLLILGLALNAARGEIMVGMPNPFVTADNLQQATEGVGYDFRVPYLLQCFANPKISYIKDYLVQVHYGDPESKNLLIRKGRGSEDISGDYNVYPTVKTVEVGERKVICKGTEEGTMSATWTVDDFSFSIGSSEPLPDAELIKLVEEMQ